MIRTKIKNGTNDNKRDLERNVNPKNKREQENKRDLARNVNPKNKRDLENKRVQVKNDQERKGENRQGMVYGQESKKYLNERI